LRWLKNIKQKAAAHIAVVHHQESVLY